LLAPRARTPTEEAVPQAQMDRIDCQFDMLVYELYGLTEEIWIEEEGTWK